MRDYLKPIDALKAEPQAVERAVAAALEAEKSRKVIVMENRKRTFLKPISAVAACLIAVLALGAVFSGISLSGEHNSFSIVANAATPDEAPRAITKNEFSSLGKLDVKSGGGSYDRDRGYFEFNILDYEASLKCEGENISEVSYTAGEDAVFGIKSNENLLNKDDEHKNGIRYYVDGSSDDNLLYYKSIKTTRDNQLDTMLYSFATAFTDEDQEIVGRFEKYFEKADPDMNVDKVKKMVEDYYKIMLRDKEITVSVKYKDGTSDKAVLELVPEITLHETVFNEKGKGTPAYDWTVNVMARIK